MKRYALAALALLLCCALSGCMGLQVLWKGLDGMSQPTPETTQEVKDEPEETTPAASAAPEETPVPDDSDFQSVRDALARNDGSFDEATVRPPTAFTHGNKAAKTSTPSALSCCKSGWRVSGTTRLAARKYMSNTKRFCRM